MTQQVAATSDSAGPPTASNRNLARLIVAAVLTGALGLMLVLTGTWALTFAGTVSKDLRRTLDGNTLTSVGVLVLVVGAVLLICLIGMLEGPMVNRWIGLIARLVATVGAAAVALSGIWLVIYYPWWGVIYTALGGLVVFTLTSYERELHSSWPWAPLRTWAAQVFALNTKGINVPRSVSVAGLVLLTLVVTTSQHQDRYFLSVAFGVLFVSLSDPGGGYLSRLRRMAVVGIVGTLLTALGFWVGVQAWGYAVLVIFMATVVAGLAIHFGLQAFTAATLLNVWVLVTLFVAAGVSKTHPWNQALAWLIGSAIATALMSCTWLLRGGSRQPSPLPEIPADAPMKLSRPIISFMVIRAIAVSGAAAIALGLTLTNGDWMPIAALIAMKTTLQQSSIRGAQRLVGAALGAGIAAVFLVTVTSHRALEEIFIALIGIGMSIYAVNYAFYATMLAGAVLIVLDLPHPANLDAEGRRIFFTFAGIAIAIVVMLVATLLQKRNAPAPSPQGS
jgi:Fusaric acid resistance protein-like